MIKNSIGLFEIRFAEMQPTGIGCQSLLTSGDRISVLIEGDHLGPILKKFFGVAAATGGPIQKDHAGGRAQQRHDLLGHDGSVVRTIRPLQRLECRVVEVPGVHRHCVSGS